jgi:hypothetical protein
MPMRKLLRIAWYSLGLLAMSGCLADVGKCGAHQEHNVYGNCVCKLGYRLDEHVVCVPCGKNEVSVENRCECEPGFARDTEGVCTPESQLGDAGRAPSGQGEACETSADCEGKEASYCETISGHVCLVPDCEVGGSDCSPDWTCCDLTGVGLPTLCVPEGSCPDA